MKQKREEINQKSKKAHYKILKRFTKQETVLLRFLVIIPYWYLRLNLKQFMGKDSKY